MKVFLEWLDDWYLGIDEIDHQHVNLARLLNKIADSLDHNTKSNHTDDQTMSLVMSLVKETRQHFKDEEAVMSQHDYPGLTQHHREHIMLLAELQVYITEIEEGFRQFDLNTLTALKHWLIDHVINNDKAFAHYVLSIKASD